MNCKELAKEIVQEMETALGAKNSKAAEDILAKKLRAMFDIGRALPGEEAVIAVYLDCGVPKVIKVNRRDMLDIRVVFLEDPGAIDDDKLESSSYYEDHVILGVHKSELMYDTKSLLEVVDSQ